MHRDHSRYRTLIHKETTDKILKAFFHIHTTLGYGFLEVVYQRAMPIALAKLGIDCQREVPMDVYYLGECVGEYRADLVVAGKVIVETKASPSIMSKHDLQIYNYLKASKLEVGLVLNFGPTATFHRYVCSDNRKS
ncbi:MAG: GxxExxY protein [Gemmatimonadaceae bacterium]